MEYRKQVAEQFRQAARDFSDLAQPLTDAANKLDPSVPTYQPGELVVVKGESGRDCYKWVGDDELMVIGTGNYKSEWQLREVVRVATEKDEKAIKDQMSNSEQEYGIQEGDVPCRTNNHSR